MGPKGREWLAQSAYDLETAEFMFRGGRYFYCAFMCHLAVEKALKGVYHEHCGQPPPKTHNLVLLLNALQLRPPPEIGRFLVRLNEASIATRYPDSLDSLRRLYDAKTTAQLLAQTREALQWIRERL